MSVMREVFSFGFVGSLLAPLVFDILPSSFAEEAFLWLMLACDCFCVLNSFEQARKIRPGIF